MPYPRGVNLKLGIVTASTGRPKRKHGLEDIVNEIDERAEKGQDISYKIINPQNIKFVNGQLLYLDKKQENVYPRNSKGRLIKRKWIPKSEREHIDFNEKFSDIDYLYVRGFKGRNSFADPIVIKKALKTLGVPMTNELSAIDYCNNKIESIVDMSVSSAEIEGVSIKDCVPATRIFNLKEVDDKAEIKDYVRKRFQGAHISQVLKTYDSRGGKGIMPLTTGSPYKALIDNYPHNNFICQDMVENCMDLRVQIIGRGYCHGDIKASYVRLSEEGDFRAQHNQSKEHYELTDLQKEVALWIHRKSGAHISAVDFGINQETDHIYFFEINGEDPGWKNLKKVYSEDTKISKNGLASEVIDFIVKNYNINM